MDAVRPFSRGSFLSPIKWRASSCPDHLSNHSAGLMEITCESILKTVKQVYYSRVSCMQQKIAINLSKKVTIKAHLSKTFMECSWHSIQELCCHWYFVFLLISWQFLFLCNSVLRKAVCVWKKASVSTTYVSTTYPGLRAY